MTTLIDAYAARALADIHGLSHSHESGIYADYDQAMIRVRPTPHGCVVHGFAGDEAAPRRRALIRDTTDLGAAVEAMAADILGSCDEAA